MANETRKKRIALGLCANCGGARTREESKKRCCGGCLGKLRNDARSWREAHPDASAACLRKSYTARKADGLCARCGTKRSGMGKTATFCERCVRYGRAVGEAYHQRKRNKRRGYVEGDGKTAKKYPMGRASTAKRAGGPWYFTLPLDTPSLDAIQVIRKRYRDAEYKAGREPLTHQNSRLVREIILRYEHRNAGVAPRKHRLITDWKLNLSLDGRTRAIVERHAARTFDGNLSATLRAMIIECQGFRRAFTGRG